MQLFPSTGTNNSKHTHAHTHAHARAHAHTHTHTLLDAEPPIIVESISAYLTEGKHKGK